MIELGIFGIYQVHGMLQLHQQQSNFCSVKSSLCGLDKKSKRKVVICICAFWLKNILSELQWMDKFAYKILLLMNFLILSYVVIFSPNYSQEQYGGMPWFDFASMIWECLYLSLSLSFGRRRFENTYADCHKLSHCDRQHSLAIHLRLTREIFGRGGLLVI